MVQNAAENFSQMWINGSETISTFFKMFKFLEKMFSLVFLLFTYNVKIHLFPYLNKLNNFFNFFECTKLKNYLHICAIKIFTLNDLKD